MRKNQQGFVSIIVTMIIIILVTMITLGFAFLARQNQRQSLNRQLSSQAFYAAESGVNDAVKNIATLGNINSCANVSSVGTPSLGANNASYTCVLVDKQPTVLVYDSISTDSSTVVHITTSSPIANLRFSWEDASNDTGFAATGSKFYLPEKKLIANPTAPLANINAQTADFPNHTGMVRATITPASVATSTDNLLNGSQTVFLYPRANATAGTTGTVTARSGGNLSQEGVFGSGECHDGNNPSAAVLQRKCNVVVTGLNTSDFYLRIKAIYKPVALSIYASDAAGVRQQLSGAQAVVDATGKSNDVLRRIQVHVPLGVGAAYFPEFAVESASTICKRAAIFPGGATVVTPSSDGGGHIYNPSDVLSGGESNDRTKDQSACALPGQPDPTF